MKRKFGSGIGSLARKPADSERRITAFYLPSLQVQLCDNPRELTIREPSYLRDDRMTI